MNYDKMKKAELVQLLKERDQQEKDYDKLFADVRRREKNVEAKEKRYEGIEVLNPSQQKRKENRIKAQAVEEINEQHKKEIEEINAKHKKEVDAQQGYISQLQLQLKLLQSGSEVNERTTQLNAFMQAHGALLKTLQGALDTALFANEYLSAQVEATNQKLKQQNQPK